MPINPSTVLRHIHMKLGTAYRPIPLTDEDIMEIIFQESLYTFSNFYPFKYNLTFNGSENVVPGQMGMYRIPIQDKGLEILGISKLWRSEGYYTGELYPNYCTNDFFELQIATDFSSAVQVPDTFRFIEPNVVEIFPKSRINYQLMVELKCIHPQHLGTIPLSLREEFFKLCVLDVKIALWNILKNYDQLSTAFGQINLRIEDFEQAETERRELLELWRQQYYKEPGRKRIWFM